MSPIILRKTSNAFVLKVINYLQVELKEVFKVYIYATIE